ncbi:hypothetical protein [Roseivirga pacifica]|uniref:RipA family octameric membrane protein n=1 Tax=Roseivirga pacifica TaxID=1267423 RepID=UPI00227D384C|nr:hypothetical protein [Roseivirga pacifica]
MRKLEYKDYQDQFRDSKREKALDRAWKNRDFEIELYWKRATYFWAFTAATFTAYFLIISKGASSILNNNPQIELIVAFMGLFFSIGWVQVNRGSKKWQENWEKHIDLLEDEITGPIYKTVLMREAPSVSGTNKTISYFVSLIWLLLVIDYFLPLKDLDAQNGLLLISLSIPFFVVFIKLLRLEKWVQSRKQFKKLLLWLSRIVASTNTFSKPLSSLHNWLSPKSGEFQFERREIGYKNIKSHKFEKSIIMSKRSPYLTPGRLADVIQAIQVLGYYKFYKRSNDAWAKQITGNSENDTQSHWKKLFEEHPEFFKIEDNDKNVSLRLRRTFKLNYHVDNDKELSKAELDKLSESEFQDRISRQPLAEQEIAMLIQTAIDLHDSAMKRKVDKRWFLPLVVALLVGWLPTVISLFSENKPIDIRLINDPQPQEIVIKKDTVIHIQKDSIE